MHTDETRAYIALLTAGMTVVLLTIFCVVMIIRYQQKVVSAYLRSIEKEIRISEAERRQTASDVHDEMSARLLGIKLKLSSLHLADPHQHQLLQEANQAIDLLANRMRVFSHQMMSPVLERNRLQAAIEELLIPLRQSGHYQIRYLWEAGSEPLRQEAATQLYRIVQEILNNIVKHAQASQIDIYVYRERKKFCLSVLDNGTGFVTPMPGKYQGLGLGNIHARAEFLNAKVYLTTGINKGTQYLLEVPEKEVEGGVNGGG